MKISVLRLTEGGQSHRLIWNQDAFDSLIV